jgi:sulfonate transport system substrate-binding protein
MNCSLRFHDISGLPVALSASDFEGTGIKDRYSPLLDNGFVSHYNDVIDGAKKVGIIRQTFEAQAWVDPAYLNRSLKELGLEGYWAPTNAAVLVAAR